jgi:hypothetical protein
MSATKSAVGPTGPVARSPDLHVAQTPSDIRAAVPSRSQLPEYAIEATLLGLFMISTCGFTVLLEGRRAVELLPASRDALEGPGRMLDLAVIYATVGDRDGAVEELRALLEIPSWASPGDLRVNSDWAEVRDDPRFQQLANRSLSAEPQ